MERRDDTRRDLDRWTAEHMRVEAKRAERRARRWTLYVAICVAVCGSVGGSLAAVLLGALAKYFLQGALP